MWRKNFIRNLSDIEASFFVNRKQHAEPLKFLLTVEINVFVHNNGPKAT